MTTKNGSYYEEYMRNHALQKHGKHDKNTRQLLTDRNTYISFLEAQLERVSAACLTTQSFEKRLAEVENSQITNDQKINSLSKVFRLNQEYMEQTTNQTSNELTSFTAKIDKWVEKYTVQAQAHETRLIQVEEHFRQCDDFIHQWSDVSNRALDDVKGTMEREIEDLKTLVFATETRIEQLQIAQNDSGKTIKTIRELVSERLDQDLNYIRQSLSEKSIAMEQKHSQLRDCIQKVSNELEKSWKLDLMQSNEHYHHKYRDTQDQVDRLHQESLAQINELRGLVRKCVDAQHLLGTSVVSLQHEVDGTPRSGRNNDNRREEKKAMRETLDALDDLRESQQRHQQALRTLQEFVHEVEENQNKDRMRLIHRLDAAERQFASWTHESLEKADELRTNVLTALEHVEKTLREDTITHQEIETVREEVRQQFTSMAAANTLLGERLQQLEALEKSRIVQNDMFNNTSTAHTQIQPQQDQNKIYTTINGPILTPTDTTELESHLSRMVTVQPERGSIQETSREEALHLYIKDLEEQLRSHRQRDELLDALQVGRTVEHDIDQVPENRDSLIQRTTPTGRLSTSSSSSLSRLCPDTKPRRSTTERRTSTGSKRRPSTKIAPSIPETQPRHSQRRSSVQSRRSIGVAPVTNVKSKRLKELCLELMALEGSMKKKGVQKK